MLVRHDRERLERGTGEACRLPFEHETLDVGRLRRIGLEAIAAGDASDREPPLVARVLRHQLRARLLDRGAGHLDELREHAGFDGLGGHEQDCLHGRSDRTVDHDGDTVTGQCAGMGT